MKALKSLETCLSVNNNLYGKLVLSLDSQITSDTRFRATSLPLFIPDFDLWSRKLDNFTFKLFIESFYIGVILK